MEQIPEEEAYAVAYNTFIFCLDAMASEPSVACEKYGHYNVAKELQIDGSDGSYIAGASICKLSDQQIRMINELVMALNALPNDAVKPTSIIEESLDNMSHKAWVPVRKMAKELIESLRQATEDNERYLSGLGGKS